MRYFLNFLLCVSLYSTCPAQSTFENDLSTNRKPWTEKPFRNDPADFQFAIVTDRTGGHRKGVFGKAVEKLNLLQPEFVMCVGDLIEGYTKDSAEVNHQWKEFNDILADLQMRFFYLPGNHDISNNMMRNQWLERYGRSYYHFKYGDVLFLAFDTNDGDGVMFSREQIDYFKEVLQEHTDVRWTMVFMHHPIWNYREFNGFEEIEALLKNRPYTVYAGHNHRYLQTTRQEQNYYILATTGGGSRLLGPRFGQYDHVTWITMTDDGPEMINLQLEGLLDHDISNDETREMARALLEAADFDFTVLNANDSFGEFAAGQLWLKLENKGISPLFFQGRFYHHHQLNIQGGPVEVTIGPGQSELIALDIEAIGAQLDTALIDPLELSWTIGYPTDRLETPFALDGTTDIPIRFETRELTFTELDIFFDRHAVEISGPFDGLLLKYTLDGSDPSFSSPTYSGPVELQQTTTIKVRYYTPDGTKLSRVREQTYRKVTPEPALQNRPESEPGLHYRYYEGEFVQLPDFADLTPVKEGVATDFQVDEVAERQDHFAILYDGVLEVPETGIYTFYLRSDDGSRLRLGDQLVVDNDGSHSARTRRGHIALEKGQHLLRLEYFEDFLGEELRLYYQRPGEEAPREFPFSGLSHHKN